MNKKAQPDMMTFEELLYVSDEEISYVKPKSIRDNGIKFSIVGIVLSFLPVFNILGVFFASKGYEQSKYDGYKGTAGLIAIFLNAISLTICIVIPLIILYLTVTAPYDVCSEMGVGKWLYEGQEYTCK